MRTVARVLLGLRVEGVDRVPLEGSVLIASNHKSYLDPLLVGACIPREIRYFAKKELFHVPLVASWVREYGAIPVDRGGFDRRGIAVALDLLERGQGLLVFPEGTRIRRPGLAEPREGIGLLALRTGAPVVPVHVAFSWEPRRTFLRRIPIRIRYGVPLRFARLKPGAEARARYPEVARAVMEAIRALGEAAPAQ